MKKIFSLLTAILFTGTMWAADPVSSQAPVDGNSYVVAAYVNNKYYALPNGTVNGGTITGVEVTLNADKKISTEDAAGKTWTLEEGTNAGKFYIKYTDDNGTYYLYKNGTGGSNYNFAVNKTSKNYWSFTANGTGYTVAAVDRGTNNVNINCNSGTFSCRATATPIILLPIGDVAECVNKISIEKAAEAPANGTFVLSNEGDNICIDNANASTKVIATPATHYHLASVTSLAKSDGTTPVGIIGTISNNQCTITDINASTVITATFAEDPKSTITWNVNGKTSTSEVYKDEKPAFPTPNPTSFDETSSTFYGWASAAWSGVAETLEDDKLATITIYTSADELPVATESVTYYAVFAKETLTPGIINESVSYGGNTDDDVTFATGSNSENNSLVNESGYTAKKINVKFTAAVSTQSTNYSYFDGTVVRYYKGATMVATPTDATITKVEIVRSTSTSSNTGVISTANLTADENNSTTNTNKFTGSTTSAVTFTNDNQCRFSQLIVYYSYEGNVVSYSKFVTSKGGTTSIDNAEENVKAVKFIENGQLFILRGEKVYTITGALVK